MQLDKPRRRSRTIGLTPLIDVVFILLLFFMLSTQFTDQQALTIKIPMSASSSQFLETDKQLSVKLLVDATLLVDGNAVAGIDQLVNNQTLLQARGDQALLFIDADDLVPLQSVITLTDTLSAMGFDNISMQALR